MTFHLDLTPSCCERVGSTQDNLVTCQLLSLEFILPRIQLPLSSPPPSVFHIWPCWSAGRPFPKFKANSAGERELMVNPAALFQLQRLEGVLGFWSEPRSLLLCPWLDSPSQSSGPDADATTRTERRGDKAVGAQVCNPRASPEGGGSGGVAPAASGHLRMGKTVP